MLAKITVDNSDHDPVMKMLKEIAILLVLSRVLPHWFPTTVSLPILLPSGSRVRGGVRSRVRGTSSYFPQNLYLSWCPRWELSRNGIIAYLPIALSGNLALALGPCLSWTLFCIFPLCSPIPFVSPCLCHGHISSSCTNDSEHHNRSCKTNSKYYDCICKTDSKLFDRRANLYICECVRKSNFIF